MNTRIMDFDFSGMQSKMKKRFFSFIDSYFINIH